MGGRGFMEIVSSIPPASIKPTQAELLNGARASMINTFGWPIGVVLDVEEHRPRPTGSGIRAEVEGSGWDDEKSYDLWELRTNGDFYLLASFFEDQQGHPDELFFNTRIVRITEAFMYLARLYGHLGVRAESTVSVTMSHGGLTDRRMSSSTSSRRLSGLYKAAVDKSTTTVEFVIGELDAELSDLVQAIAAPMFELFDFFQLNAAVFDEVIDRFVDGEVS